MAAVFKERRKDKRFNVSKLGNVIVNDKEISCIILNISKGGICFFTKPDVEIEGSFKFSFNDDEQNIHGEAKVIYNSSSYESNVFGCKILSISPYNYTNKYV